YKRLCCSLIPTESDSLPHAHAQNTKTYYKHQDSRINKAQVLKTKTFANSDKQDLHLRYQVYQGRLLARDFNNMQSMSMLVMTQDRKVAKTIKTEGKRFKDLGHKDEVKRQ
ncbi:hypothetical protein Tco_1171277, partial [Tanacetum coccineum]